GYAYLADNGDVYFQVEKFASYGELSHRDLENLQAGARVEVNEVKKNPLDFVLWKKSKKNEPSYPSPWGEGRPGWHIECSAMSTHCLGKHFDIHGGGHDLIFPHHENERAQSEGAFEQTFVNTWMHVGFVQVNKEKMSKSLNNFFTIREILQNYSGEVLRYFLLSSHYRSPLQYGPDLLENAKSGLSTLYMAIRGVTISHTDTTLLKNHPIVSQFEAVMNDDFNTPKAISLLFELAHTINTRKQKGESSEKEAAVLKYLGSILGLLQQESEQFLQGESLDFDVEAMIAARNQARLEKNWAKADEIRNFLLEKGIVLEDTATTTLWRRN
ncbi:MAG TPA: cysteine--tRNA ligase, partial [Gammaproteobacteria bacterium]|nr:cysteine--tRNA ligase [Gammaproteobacteria bacterium]